MKYIAKGLEFHMSNSFSTGENSFGERIPTANLIISVENICVETPIGDIKEENSIIKVPLNESEIQTMKSIFDKARKRVASEKAILIEKEK